MKIMSLVIPEEQVLLARKLQTRMLAINFFLFPYTKLSSSSSTMAENDLYHTQW